jgi:hypothetical protein
VGTQARFALSSIVVRHRTVIATVALLATLALASLPGPAVSTPGTTPAALDPSAFRPLRVDAPILGSSESAVAAEPVPTSAGYLDATTPLFEPGEAPEGTAERPGIVAPTPRGGTAWKPPRYTMSGYASFYDHGTTAMRLPRGTVVRICGAGGCIERVVTDYGPSAKIHPERIADLYRPDFFRICGCASYSGTTWVTVSVY